MPLCFEPHAAPPQRVLWDPAIEDEAREARALIDGLRAKGFVDAGGSEQDGEIVLSPPARPPDTGLMRVLSQNGDDRIVWSRRSAEQVREAYAKFDEFLSKGYRAYSMLANGERGHELFAFDPMVEECLLVPTGRLVPG